MNKYAKENIFIEEAYSNSIFTYESLIAAFKGENTFQNENYKLEKVKIEECKFVKILKENYEEIELSLSKEALIIEVENSKCMGTISQNLWEIVTDLANNKRSVARFNYNMIETHFPFLYVEEKRELNMYGEYFFFEKIDEEKHIEKQFKNALKYVDRQLEYYLEILKQDNIDFILFSDHGNHGELYSEKLEKVKSGATWANNRIRIPVICSGDQSLIKQKRFSIKNIDKLIEAIVKKKEYRETDDTTCIQFSGFNNGEIVNTIKKSDLKYLLGAFEIRVNKNYKMIITERGYFDVFDLNDKSIENYKEKEQILLENLKFFSNQIINFLEERELYSFDENNLLRICKKIVWRKEKL